MSHGSTSVARTSDRLDEHPGTGRGKTIECTTHPLRRRQGRTIHNTYLIQQYNTIRIIQQYARQATPAAVYNTVTVLGVKYTSDKVGGPNTPKYTTAAARVGSASGSSAASAVSINVGSGGCGGLWTLAADGLDFAQLGWGGGLAIIRPVLIQQYNTIRIIQQYSKIRRVLSYPGSRVPLRSVARPCSRINSCLSEGRTLDQLGGRNLNSSTCVSATREVWLCAVFSSFCLKSL